MALFRRYRVRARRKSTLRYRRHKEAARALAHARLSHFNQQYGLTYRRVFIRDQRSRWGSCSKKGNLNFNYRIALLPEHLLDYIIVHELCHLKHFDHSADFWGAVSQAIPDHAARRSELLHIVLR